MFWKFLVLRKSSDNQKGFGLIELLVAISIVSIVASIIFARQGSFNSAVLLRSEAYDIALRIREIQLNAVSASSGGDNEFRSILGVHFDTTDNGKYYIFRDTNEDGFYQASEQFDIQGNLDPRFEIREIRSVGTLTSTHSETSIIFVRPNFDARFFMGSGPVNEISDPVIEIDIGERGKTFVRTIEVTSTGQIGVI